MTKKQIDAEVAKWKELRKSKIFDYWYFKFMNELLYDLQLLDIEQKGIIKKYHKKLIDFKKEKKKKARK